MTKVALVGKPNAGKSSLFNLLLKSRDAITSEQAGTTRDIKKRVALIDGHEFMIIDTGGLEDRDEMFVKVKEKALQTVKTADIVLYMCDGRVLPDEDDKKLFFQLKKDCENIAVVINKIDNDKLKENLYDFYGFGSKEIFAISCAHGRGIEDLKEWMVDKKSKIDGPVLAEEENIYDDFLDDFDDDGELITKEEETLESNEINIAIIGRPNVGKSSLLNALLNEERSVVSSIAGTTIDPVDEEMTYKDKLFKFVDTAGVRKRSKILGIEKYAFDRTEKMLEKSDVALLVLDSSEEFTELDEKIAGLVDKYKLATIIVINKYDIAYDEYEIIEKEIRRKFRFLEHAPLVTISALTKKRVHKLNDLILEVFNNYSKRLSTSELNVLLKDLQIKHQIPSSKGKVAKIYFATQFAIKPPKIALICNHPEWIHFSYIRYIKNQIREALDLSGSPIVIIPKKRGQERVEDRQV